jgi:hypothetical protein
MMAGLRSGMNAADARVVSSDGFLDALIRRFDRTTTAARLLDISAATLLGADPSARLVGGRRYGNVRGGLGLARQPHSETP